MYCVIVYQSYALTHQFDALDYQNTTLSHQSYALERQLHHAQPSIGAMGTHFLVFCWLERMGWVENLCQQFI